MIKYLPYGENLVKIGPVNTDLSLLKNSLLKAEKINASKTDSPRGRHAALAK